MDTHIVIMAGGVGSRLWPASTPECPKQFIDVLGVGKTMIQLTVERFSPIVPMDRFWIVTSGAYVDKVREQLPGIPEDQILAEPEARNTAPCIAYACWKIAKNYPGANIVVSPADAIVLNKEEFVCLISSALKEVASTDKIVTIGVRPTRPETGYGYICAENSSASGAVKVSSFKEKPDKELALKYIRSGNYFWNAGIFVWNVNTVISEMWKYAPNIAAIMDQLSPDLYTAGEKVALMKLFPQCEKKSIDYAVMEKSANIFMISGDMGWSDLGTWGAVKQYMDADADGNVKTGGDVRLFNCSNCVVHTPDTDTVVLEGLDGYVVALREGNLLVSRISEEQNIRNFSKKTP